MRNQELENVKVAVPANNSRATREPGSVSEVEGVTCRELDPCGRRRMSASDGFAVHRIVSLFVTGVRDGLTWLPTARESRRGPLRSRPRPLRGRAGTGTRRAEDSEHKRKIRHVSRYRQMYMCLPAGFRIDTGARAAMGELESQLKEQRGELTWALMLRDP